MGSLKEFAEIVNFEKNDSLERTVTSVLFAFGISANIKGYQYVREAIVMTVRNRESVDLITKVIYPDIAKVFCTTPSRVERAIRHAIEVAWQRSDTELLNNLFDNSKVGIKKRPTNSEFIATIADGVIICRENYAL